MSELPSGWATATLGELCVPTEMSDPASRPDDTFTYVDIGSIKGQAIRNPKRLLGRDAPSRARKVVFAGDTVVSTVRTYLRNTATVPDELDGAIASTGFCVLRPAHGIAPKFLYYRVTEAGFVNRLSEKQSGSSYPAVRDSDVLAEQIELPPGAEQQRIVAAIEEQLSRLDAADACLLMSLRRLRMLRSAAVQRALGDGWQTVELGEVTEHQGYGSSAKATTASDGGVPIIAMGNIQDGALVFDRLKYLPADHDDVGRYRLSPGDLLFNRTNSPELVGKSAVYREGSPEALFASYLIRVRLEPVCDPEWAALVMNSAAGRQYIAAVRTQQVGQANVNGSKLKRFPIPLPPLSEQRLRLDELDQLTTVAKAVGAAIDLAKRRSGTLRQALLASAFAGTLLPQDPTDEPAHVLIDRIAAERSASAVGRSGRKRTNEGAE